MIGYSITSSTVGRDGSIENLFQGVGGVLELTSADVDLLYMGRGSK